MLKVSKHMYNRVSILNLTGDLDYDGILALEGAIHELWKSGAGQILLNFSGITSVMNAYINSLFTPIQAITEAEGTVALCGLNSKTHKTLKRAIFYPLVKIYDSEIQALKEFEDANLISAA